VDKGIEDGAVLCEEADGIRRLADLARVDMSDVKEPSEISGCVPADCIEESARE
jgi:hypothetical protein